MSRFRGLTWDHPRGYESLVEAAASVPELIRWDKQPLEGFESRPIEEICAEYDVVVLDHPHLGDALASDSLQPIDKLLPVEELAAIRARTIGPCFDSYVMDGCVWALPLDAAAQVSAGRPDLMGEPLPLNWREVESVASLGEGFVMSLAGPHAFLSLLSICATFDDRFGSVPNGLLQPHHDEAVSLFTKLLFRSHPLGATHNPIGILTAMAAGAGPIYCPLIFGYVPFAERSATAPILFRDAPSFGGLPHAVLGGTGLAVTKRCDPDAELLEHLLWLMSAEIQSEFLPRHSGQPSAVAAWTSPALNEANADFYAGTLTTLRNAFVRPRMPTFVPAQNSAASWLRELRSGSAPSEARVRIEINRILSEQTGRRAH